MLGREWDAARHVASPPAAFGGLGLASAERIAPAAYWAAWADGLPVMLQRRPGVANRCARELAFGGASTARSGMPCFTGHSRRPRTLSLQSPEVGLTLSRSWPLAYSTFPIASASSAACHRVPELCSQLLPLDMQIALRKHLRLPLPLAASRCDGHGEPSSG